MTDALDAAANADITEVLAVGDHVERFTRARQLRAKIREWDQALRAAQREDVNALKGEGQTWKQVGSLLGISGARAEQIAKNR